MRLPALLAVLSPLVCLAAALARAASAGALLLAVDSFRPTNSGDGFKGALENGAHGVSAGASSSGSVETKNSIGGRLGIFAPVSPYVLVGPSFGYIHGPNANATLFLNGGAGTVTAQRDLSWLRLLTEVQMRFPLTRGDAALVLGAGLGIARGSLHESVSCAGAGCALSSSDGRAHWFGPTWEVSPGFAFKSFLVGYRLAWFPKYGGTDRVSRLDWKTSELFAALYF